ncbi:sensor histidine kinase [Cohnella nanjingensis]|nr:ATP-binding protein [Cohnella nanjingensis]
MITLALAFFGVELRPVWKRSAAFACLGSLLTEFHVLSVPVVAGLLIGISVSFACIVLFYLRILGWGRTVLLFLLFTLIGITSDASVVALTSTLYPVHSQVDLIVTNFWDTMSVYLPVLALYLLIALRLNRRPRTLIAQLKRILPEWRRDKTLRVLGLSAFQVILLCALFFLKFDAGPTSKESAQWLIYALLAATIAALFYTLKLLVATREQAVRSTQALYLEDIDRMFTAIRGQRHDFLNHVQIIHSMLQMNNQAELKAYVRELVKETREMSDIVNHSAPALAALIQAKATAAVNRSIDFTYELPVAWDQLSSVKTIDIVKIIGNLVNNAFDEVAAARPPGERQVHAAIRTTPGAIELSVVNCGQPLSDDVRAQLFTAGYTTKRDGHSGLGLAIVQERVKHYNGTIDIRSTAESGTEFLIRLPNRAS